MAGDVDYMIVYTDAGGLRSYGVQSVERYHRAATYVDRILKGAKPADMPSSSRSSSTS